MLHFVVEEAFDDLLCCWRVHHDVVRSPTSTVVQRGEARVRLDKARERMHRLRLAVYPEPDEAASVVDSVWCEVLDVVVHLRWEDRDPVRPGNFRCACGNHVPIDWDVTGVERNPALRISGLMVMV